MHEASSAPGAINAGQQYLASHADGVTCNTFIRSFVSLERADAAY